MAAALFVVAILFNLVLVYTLFRVILILCEHFKLELFVTKFGKLCLIMSLVAVFFFQG